MTPGQGDDAEPGAQKKNDTCRAHQYGKDLDGGGDVETKAGIEKSEKDAHRHGEAKSRSGDENDPPKNPEIGWFAKKNKTNRSNCATDEEDQTAYYAIKDERGVDDFLASIRIAFAQRAGKMPSNGAGKPQIEQRIVGTESNYQRPEPVGAVSQGAYAKGRQHQSRANADAQADDPQHRAATQGSCCINLSHGIAAELGCLELASVAFAYCDVDASLTQTPARPSVYRRPPTSPQIYVHFRCQWNFAAIAQEAKVHGNSGWRCPRVSATVVSNRV
jgi:hypothetical protein